MKGNKPDFQPIFKELAKTADNLLKNAHDGINALERHIVDIFDQQVINRLLVQYDKFIEAGLRPQEAFDAVINLIKQRLETAIRERA